MNDADRVAEVLRTAGDPIVLVREAIGLRDANRYAEAKNLLSLIIEAYPNLDAPRYESAFISRLAGEPREAVNILEPATGSPQFGFRCWMLLAHMLHAVGAHPEANDALRAATPVEAGDRRATISMFAYGRYLHEYPLGRALSLIDRVRRKHQWRETKEVAEEIGVAIRERSPYCLVRLGDGEGGMLVLDNADEANYQALYDRNRDELVQMWFGPSFDWRSGNFFKVAQTLPMVIAGASMVGIPYESWIRHEYSISSLRGVPSLVNVYRHMARVSISKKICSQHIHLDLYNDGYLLPLIRAADNVRVISCLPEVAERLKDRLELSSVILYLIPPEQGSKHILGQNGCEGNHFPEVFDFIRSKLTGEVAGQVFLVAAGILGKFYCETIKAYGGIALDVGSLVDGWVGRETRPGYTRDMLL